jgi:hypothetical protein
MIPEPRDAEGRRPPPVVHSVLDRRSLLQIAIAGGGEYFEIGTEPDRVVAFKIIDRLRRRARDVPPTETFEDLYRRALMGAAVVLCLGTVFLYKPSELAWQTAGALAVVALLATLIA